MKRITFRALAMLYVPVLLVLLIVALSARHYGIPVGDLTRDMAAVADCSPLAGALSNLGILVWCAAAAISFFGSYAARAQGDKRQASFLFAFACLTTFLMLDDFFMFHDYFAPQYLGVHKRHVFIFYLIVAGGVTFAFRREILGSDYALFGLAVFFLAMHSAVDAIPHHGYSWLFLGEDGPKFMGIVTWAAYFARHSFQLLAAPALERAGAPGGYAQADGGGFAAAQYRKTPTKKL